jgi:hypothetical protein
MSTQLAWFLTMVKQMTKTRVGSDKLHVQKFRCRDYVEWIVRVCFFKFLFEKDCSLIAPSVLSQAWVHPCIYIYFSFSCGAAAQRGPGPPHS